MEPVFPRAPGLVLLREADGVRWTARFLGALLDGRSIALAPADALPAEVECMKTLLATARFDEPSILVRTGGTTGRLRWAQHTWSSLTASAEGFLTFFGDDSATGVRVLPLHHVGGLMTVVRAVCGGGAVVHGDYRELGHGLNFPPGATLSLVPTQLHRILKDADACAALRTVGRILLGGARSEPGLLSAARASKLPLAPCYGMTETAAAIIALTPDEFLRGGSGVGMPLPHVELVWKTARARADLPSGCMRLGVRSPSLCRGYWPNDQSFAADPWWTPDVAVQNPDGAIEIVGRTDRIIISGGENVDAEHIEAVLREIHGVKDICVFGVPDADWGQRVAAAVVRSTFSEPIGWQGLLRDRLSAAERPKQWLEVDELPRTAMGKLDLQELVKRCQGISEAGEASVAP